MGNITFDYEAERAKRRYPTRPTNVEQDQIEKLLAEGKSIDEVAKTFRIGRVIVSMINRGVRDNTEKIETREVPQVMTDEKIHEPKRTTDKESEQNSDIEQTKQVKNENIIKLEIGSVVIEVPENINFRVEQNGGFAYVTLSQQATKKEVEKANETKSTMPIIPGMPRIFRENPEKLTAANKLFETGVSIRQIARQLEVQYYNMLRAFKAEGLDVSKKLPVAELSMPEQVEVRTRPLMPTASERIQIVQEYEDGTSTRQLIEKYNTTRGHIHQILRDAEVELRDERKDGNPRNEKLRSTEKDAIDRLYREGKSPHEIVEALGGVNIGQVKYYLRQNHMA